MKTMSTAEVLSEVLVSVNECDSNLEPANVVDGLFAIARSIDRLATQVKYLGGGNNGDERGAVEFLAIKVEEAARIISESMRT